MDETTERVFETRCGRGGSLVFRRANGTTIWKRGLPLTTLIDYNYNSVPNPPPSSGQLRTNSAVVPDITIIWVHRLDSDGRDVKFLLAQLEAGSQLYLQDVNDSDSRAVFQLVADPVDDGDHLTFRVECDYASGAPLQGTGLLIGAFL